MFDKYKARFAKFEEDHESVHKVIQHLRDNQKTYLVGAGCLSAGYLLRKPNVITVINETAPAIAPVFNNNNIGNIVNNTVNNGGHMRKIVKCIETGELWLSVTDTAKAQGKNISLMSQHLNHPEVVPDINGLHFAIEALATS